MKVHHIIPYSLEKNLGVAYNEAMALIPEGDWACLQDYDVMLLTPDAPAHIHEYAVRNPNVAMLTCLTNRVHPKSTDQLFSRHVDDDSNMRRHIEIAELSKRYLYDTQQIHDNISGMLMLMSKAQWKKTPFVEDLKCLGVDTEMSKTLRERGEPVLRMNGIYVWHTYRIMNGIRDKTHLL